MSISDRSIRDKALFIKTLRAESRRMLQPDAWRASARSETFLLNFDFPLASVDQKIALFCVHDRWHTRQLSNLSRRSPAWTSADRVRTAAFISSHPPEVPRA